MELVDESKRSNRGALGVAAASAALGETDQALRWLEEAYKEHDPNMVFLSTGPEFQGLRADARFKDLVPARRNSRAVRWASPREPFEKSWRPRKHADVELACRQPIRASRASCVVCGRRLPPSSHWRWAPALTWRRLLSPTACCSGRGRFRTRTVSFASRRSVFRISPDFWFSAGGIRRLAAAPDDG